MERKPELATLKQKLRNHLKSKSKLHVALEALEKEGVEKLLMEGLFEDTDREQLAVSYLRKICTEQGDIKRSTLKYITEADVLKVYNEVGKEGRRKLMRQVKLPRQHIREAWQAGDLGMQGLLHLYSYAPLQPDEVEWLSNTTDLETLCDVLACSKTQPEREKVALIIRTHLENNPEINVRDFATVIAELTGKALPDIQENSYSRRWYRDEFPHMKLPWHQKPLPPVKKQAYQSKGLAHNLAQAKENAQGFKVAFFKDCQDPENPIHQFTQAAQTKSEVIKNARQKLNSITLIKDEATYLALLNIMQTYLLKPEEYFQKAALNPFNNHHFFQAFPEATLPSEILNKNTQKLLCTINLLEHGILDQVEQQLIPEAIRQNLVSAKAIKQLDLKTILKVI